MILTTHLHIVPRLRMSGVKPPHPTNLHGVLSDNFTLSFPLYICSPSANQKPKDASSRGDSGLLNTVHSKVKVKVKFSFLNLGSRWRSVVNVTPRPLYPRERPGSHCIGCWLGPRTGLDRCGESRPQRNSILVPSTP